MASPSCHAAIPNCIDGDFHDQDDGLDNEDFCHNVYNKAVALLERDLKYL